MVESAFGKSAEVELAAFGDPDLGSYSAQKIACRLTERRKVEVKRIVMAQSS
ncbi:hypothetical protein [Bradyrhizobium sp. USDA 3315]